MEPSKGNIAIEDNSAKAMDEDKMVMDGPDFKLTKLVLLEGKRVT